MSIWPETEGMWFPYKIQEWYYWIIAWFKGPHNIIFLNIPPTWHDKDGLILLAVFKLFVDCVEKEHLVEHWCWNECQQDIDELDKILKAYKWIKTERAIAIKVYDDELDRVYGQQTIKRIDTSSEDIKKVRDAEQYYENKDQEILHDIITIRNRLWT